MADMSTIERLISLVEEQQRQIHALSEKLKEVNIGAGGGNASVADYESGIDYKRNNIVVDTMTETCYRVLIDYTSDTVQNDCLASYVPVTSQPADFDPEDYYWYNTSTEQYVAGVSGETWGSHPAWFKYSAKLKLLAAEGQVIGLSHHPDQDEINNLPEDSLVAIYSKTGSTYIPD